MYSNEQAFDLKSQLNVKEFYKKLIGTIEDRSPKYYTTLCPFHNDHNPSFKIDKKTGVWHCYVDGIYGDMIDFVERFHGLSFSDAMAYIIREFDVKIEMSEEAKKQHAIKSSMIKLHTVISNFYQSELYKNKEAINYLRDRKIDTETINKFKIGFVPETKVCNKEEFKSLFFNSGLAWENGNNFFTKNRISIPFQDNYGHIVGFTARTIFDDKPKYLHSKTTNIFKKDELLFAFNHAKKSIEETKSVFFVEGQFDCIRAHQFGITNCVALSGLTLSNKQITNLKNICKNYYIILEDAKAENISKNGKESALDRIHDTIISNNSWATIKVIKLYSGENKCDLDDFLLNNGKGAFINKIKEAPTYNEYVLVEKLKHVNYKTIEEKSNYIYSIRKYLNKIEEPIKKKYYISLIHKKLEYPEGDIYSILTRANSLDKISNIGKYDDAILSSKKYIISSLFSKFGYYNSYKVLEELNITNILDKEFLNIYNKIKDIVLQNGKSCDIINLLHSSNLTSEELSIVDDCFFKSDELDYLDETYDNDNLDDLFELREFLKDQIKNLE